MKRYEQVYRIPLIILKFAGESIDEKEPLQPKLFRPSSHRKTFLLTKIWKSRQKLSCWQNLCWKQQSWIFPSADGQSIVIGFDGNWWRASEGEGNFRQIPICAMKTFSFFRFSIIIPVEPFYRFYILRQLLLMADRPQPIILSTQIITEICTHTQATAWSIHAT